MDRYEFYYQVAQAHITTQNARNDQMEVKAGIAIGFSGTIIGLASLTVGLWNAWSIFVASIMAVAFVWAVSFAIALLLSHKWDLLPDLKELERHVRNLRYTDVVLMEWVAGAYSAALERNNYILNHKADMLAASFAGMVVEGALLGGLLLTTQL
jgi:hypothetical protein